MHPAADFAIGKVYVMIIAITQKEKPGRLVKNIEQKNSFPPLYSSVFTCRRKLGVWRRQAAWQG